MEVFALFVNNVYLSKIGFSLDNNVISCNPNSKFPGIYAKLDDNDNIIFVLSFYVNDDFNKCSITFSFEEWNELGYSLFDGKLPVNFFDFFSIHYSLLNRIYSSRLNGRKAWKKRLFHLPIKWSKVYNAFGLSYTKASSSSNEKEVDSSVLVELQSVMDNAIKKAASDFSYAPFDIFFDAFKKHKRLLSSGGRTSRKKVFELFKQKFS